jgi:hypothetical protein
MQRSPRARRLALDRALRSLANAALDLAKSPNAIRPVKVQVLCCTVEPTLVYDQPAAEAIVQTPVR